MIKTNKINIYFVDDINKIYLKKPLQQQRPFSVLPFKNIDIYQCWCYSDNTNNNIIPAFTPTIAASKNLTITTTKTKKIK